VGFGPGTCTASAPPQPAFPFGGIGNDAVLTRHEDRSHRSGSFLSEEIRSAVCGAVRHRCRCLHRVRDL
jgi:hypothetical protein